MLAIKISPSIGKKNPEQTPHDEQFVNELACPNKGACRVQWVFRIIKMTLN